MLVHDFIFKLLVELCPEDTVREQLWSSFLVDKLRTTYMRAMEHARFLLRVERGGRPSTFNHYFNANLQKKRRERSKQQPEDKENSEMVREDILDILMSYYKVSRKRFVDVICRQVIDYFLLDGDENPLKIFGPELIMGLDTDQLEMVAGEGAISKTQRSVLKQNIERLDTALKILRT